MNPTQQTILVVDDDPHILMAVSLRLKAAGYRVMTSSDGVEALTMIQLNHPAAIITDIWMPIGVGFSLAFRLQEWAPEIPVIFLTASKRAGLREMARKAGAAAFLEKPYSPEVLLTTLAKVLAKTIPKLDAPTSLLKKSAA